MASESCFEEDRSFSHTKKTKHISSCLLCSYDACSKMLYVMTTSSVETPWDDLMYEWPCGCRFKKHGQPVFGTCHLVFCLCFVAELPQWNEKRKAIPYAQGFQKDTFWRYTRVSLKHSKEASKSGSFWSLSSLSLPVAQVVAEVGVLWSLAGAQVFAEGSVDFLIIGH